MESLTILLKELKSVAFSVTPLIVILLVLKYFVFRSPLESSRQFIFGAILTIVGLFVFLQGAQMSLIPVAESTGADLYKVGRGWIIVIAFCIGFVATLVEPALSVTAREIEDVSVGAINSRLVLMLTATGFAIGMAVGVVKIIYNINFAYILVPALIILAILGYFCHQTYSAIAFDCAAATTGPVNIPINMAIALGLARSIEGLDPLTAGFGIVGMTVLGVAMTMMTFGVIRGGGF